MVCCLNWLSWESQENIAAVVVVVAKQQIARHVITAGFPWELVDLHKFY